MALLAQIAFPETDEPPATSPVGPPIASLAGMLRETACAIARQGGISSPALGMGTVLSVLWSRMHRFDAADAHWPDRDRFVLSHQAATPLLYALLHLSGHSGMEQATLNHCGELNAVAALVAEYGRHPAIEASAAPGGQVVAEAVGMALAERVLAGRFGKSLVDHRTWAVCDAAELGHGVTREATSLAGQLRLDRLVLLVDATAGEPDDERPRFASGGWAVKTVSADDAEQIENALSFALRSRKPTIIWCIAGEGLAEVSGNEPALRSWREAGSRGAAARRSWLKRIARHPQRPEFERALGGRLMEGWQETLAALKLPAGPGIAVSVAATCRQLVDRLAPSVPELLCGRTNGAMPDSAGRVLPGGYSGRYLDCTGRPHGMAACINGIALHGGTLPFGASQLLDAGEQLPALRQAAMLRKRIIHLAFDDGFAAPAAAWRPVELLAALRAIPQLHLFRPGCALEAVECLELALRRTDGPALLVLAEEPARSDLRQECGENRCARGGYVLSEAEGPRQVTLIATGTELVLAVDARAALAEDGIAAAVVSLPCWALFAQQDSGYRRSVLGGAPRIGLEAGARDGWDRWLGEDGVFIGCEAYDASGPAEAVRRHYGLTVPLIRREVRSRLRS